MYCYIIGILSIILIILICIMVFQRKKYINRLKYSENNFIQAKSMCDSYLKDIRSLKNQLDYYEDEEYKRNDGFETLSGKIQKKPIYKGRKALIGDYCSWSARNTKNVLKSLGFDVDIVASGKDIIKKMQNEEHYDIIFSNNIYEDCTGPECLKELRQLDNFSTPIIIHTISDGKEDEFINVIGFDGYIVKPVSQEKIIPILKNLLDKQS